MKYVVSVAIDGRIDVEVEANSFEEARLLAALEAGNTDWNQMELVSCNAVNAEDENGKFIDY
jgi:hypothetical protein